MFIFGIYLFFIKCINLVAGNALLLNLLLYSVSFIFRPKGNLCLFNPQSAFEILPKRVCDFSCLHDGISKIKGDDGKSNFDWSVTVQGNQFKAAYSESDDPEVRAGAAFDGKRWQVLSNPKRLACSRKTGTR